MTGALSSPAEIEQACADFKEGWYGVAKRIEMLADFSSGEEPAFRRTLAEMSRMLSQLLEELSVIARSVKRHKPEVRTEVDAKTGSIEAELRELRSKVEEEIEKLDRFLEAKQEVSGVKKELEKIEREFREVDARVSTLCTKFFERQRELKLAKEKIKARLEKALYDLQSEFVEKVSSIAGDEYELRYNGEAAAPEKVFKLLIRDPDAPSRVSLVRKKPSGLFSFKLRRDELDEEEKLEVLRYIAQEIGEKARRVKEEEMEKARSLSREFADLDALEKACRDVEKRRQELENYRSELELRIRRLKEGVNRNFDDYNEILSLREELSSAFDSIEPEVRDFLEYIASSFEGLEIERDPEKRRLLEKIRELEDRVEELAARVEKLSEERNALQEEVGRYLGELQEKSREVANLEKERSELTRRMEELESRYEELKKSEAQKAEHLREVNENLQREVETLKAELSKLRSESERLEEEKRGLEKELEEQRARAEKAEEALENLKSEIVASLQEIIEKIKG